MRAILMRGATIVVVASSIAFGATEAWASQSALHTKTCGTWNWCAPSQGGPHNCSRCCDQQSGGTAGGLCYDDSEFDNFQGCLCY
jgi:hypothetical protein